jgi:hypothetical protein
MVSTALSVENEEGERKGGEAGGEGSGRVWRAGSPQPLGGPNASPMLGGQFMARKKLIGNG